MKVYGFKSLYPDQIFFFENWINNFDFFWNFCYNNSTEKVESTHSKFTLLLLRDDSKNNVLWYMAVVEQW